MENPIPPSNYRTKELKNFQVNIRLGTYKALAQANSL